MAATIKDIAKRTGLSVGTVSKCLNGIRVREESRVEILEAAKQLDYRPNQMARGLKTHCSKTIGVVVPSLCTFNTQIISMIEDALRSKGYATILCDCREDVQYERGSIQFLINKTIDGIINIPIDASGEHLRPAQEIGVPVVVLDQEMDRGFNRVVINNEEISALAVRRLLEHGHQKIGLLCGPLDRPTQQVRYRGYRQALEEQNLFDEHYVQSGGLTAESARQGLCELLARCPDMTAVFFSSHAHSIGGIQALHELRLAVPEQISVVGFDLEGLAKVMLPQPAYICQPTTELAREAVRILLESLNGRPDVVPENCVLDAKLVDGQSIAARPCMRQNERTFLVRL